MNRLGSARRVRAAFVLLLLARPPGLAAQQFVTNDAALIEARACQLEAWHGRIASWILPACHFVPNLELTVGVGFVEDDRRARRAEYVVQGKYLLLGMTANRPGVGVVAGFGMDPLGQTKGERFDGFFAYVPLSLSIGADRLILHANLGWHFERDEQGHDHGHDHEDAPGHHAFTWAGRADVLLPVPGGRFTAIAEAFGEDRLLPEYQLGVRTLLIPDRLHADVSWGGHTQSGLSGMAWIFGIAWTPPPFR